MRIRIDRTKVKVLKHHRAVDVFTDGRYLHVSMKISTQSKNGRQLARETAAEILNAVGSSDAAREVFERAQSGQGDEPAPAGFEDGKSSVTKLGQTGLDP